MTLEEWDRRIGPRLSLIENAAHWLKFDAVNLQSAIEGLEARPAWETFAREKMGEAEVALRTALALVMATQRIYDNLPPIIDTHMEQKNESVTNVPVQIS